jgi:hypothetical protein
MAVRAGASLLAVVGSCVVNYPEALERLGESQAPRVSATSFLRQRLMIGANSRASAMPRRL